jgi:hypothetical protein
MTRQAFRQGTRRVRQGKLASAATDKASASAKAKRSDKIMISRDDVRGKPSSNDQLSAIEADSPAAIPSRVDDRSPQSRKRTIMARYVFGDELKPGERWKRRLFASR